MPSDGKSRIWAIAGLLTVAVLAVVLIPATGAMLGIGPDSSRNNWPAQFRSNGERIYFSGTSSSGLPITSNGGGMHMQMHAGGCVTCHGADRLGGRLMPRFWVTAPPLTAAALFKADDEHSGEDRHGDHDAYDEATLRRAITEGIDPEGERLDPAMPRWSMDDRDATDLIGFLRSTVAE